ncbi:MAG: glycosyltransferase [Ardenticatenales bacterium]|nr:glycosyltransferase [Ardenticatenales bacterium]
MKVYYVTAVDIAIPGGAQVNEREFVTTLIRQYPDQVHCILPRPSTALAELVGAPVSYLPQAPKGNLLSYLSFEWNLYQTVRKLLQEQGTDSQSILAMRPTPTTILLPWYAQRNHIAFSLRVAGAFPEPTLIRNKVPAPLVPVTSWALLESIRWRSERTTAFVAVTQTIVRQYVERLGIEAKKFTVIPNGVNIQLFTPRDQQQTREKLGLTRFKHWIGYVGSLMGNRGISQIIDAAKYLSTLRSDIGFLIVGGGAGNEDQSTFQALVKEAGLEDQFVFVGWIPYDQVALHIGAFDIGLATFPKEKMRWSGSASQKVRQYLACGVPVVASRGDGHEFIQNDHLGLCIEAEDPHEFGQAILSLLELSAEQKLHHREHARQYALDHLSMEKVVSEYMHVWASSLPQAAPHTAQNSAKQYL